MRIEFAGGLNQPSPLVLNLVNGVPFIPADYISMGYTYFDVICIGAGGGMGGGINTNNTGTLLRNFGGAGGGGGLHRVKGLLSALPSSCPVVVGSGGAPGADHVSTPGLTTDGANGGYSSFNNTTCVASGGKGGRHVESNSTTVTTLAHGGEGGIGGRSTVGGGAAGGLAGTPSPTTPTPGTDGQDGGWDSVTGIGAGGGGGAGGVGKYSTPTTYLSGTYGGRGSYNPSDLLVFGPAYPPRNDPDTNSINTMPGAASGAKASPVNGLSNVYGQSVSASSPGENGIVVIRLTAL